jgi:hypothetical protein
MAFTIVSKYDDSKAPVQGRWAAGIRLASTRQPCKIWQDMGPITESSQEEVISDDGVSALDKAGTWWVEQPAIVYDPSDVGKEYKVFYYKYLWEPEDKSKGLSRIYSIIGYKYASNPDIRQWSTEDWIFSARAKTDTFHGNPPDPYNGLTHYHLDQFDPSLKDMWFYSRPSVVSYNDKLYMTLSAWTQTGMTPDRVIMVVSPDHARTWHYVSTILTRDDLPKMGAYTKLDGGTLFVKAGQLYFAVVLGDDKVLAGGVHIIPFDEPAKGTLKRDKNGAPLIINQVGRVSVKPSELGGGYAAYSDMCKGLYVSEYSGLKDNIHIFQTMKDPVEH